MTQQKQMRLMHNILATFLKFLRTAGGTPTQKVVRGSVWVFTAYGLQSVFSLIRSVILARLLVPADFGLMGLVSLSIIALGILTNTGVWPALIQRRTLDDELLSTGWTIAVFRGLVLGLVTALLAPVAAWFFETPLLAPVIRVMAVTFFLKGLNSMSLLLLEREMNFRALTFFSLVVSVLSTVAAVAAAFALRNVWALVIGELAGGTLGLLLSYALRGFRPRFRFARQSAQELLHFGKYVTGAGIVSYLTTQGDDAYVGKFLGTEALGFYGMAYHLSNLPATTISRLLSRVTLPGYCALQDDLNGLRRLYLHTLRITALITMPIAGSMFVLASHIVQVFYGSKWMPVVPSFMILCLFGLERSIGSLVGSVFLALGKPKLLFYLNLTKLIAMAAGIVPLTAQYGFLGTSVAVTISAIVVQSAVVLVVSRQLGMPILDMIRQVSAPLFGTACMMASVWALKEAFAWPVNVASLVVLVLAAAAVYVAVMVPSQRDLFYKVREILILGAAGSEYEA